MFNQQNKQIHSISASPLTHSNIDLLFLFIAFQVVHCYSKPTHAIVLESHAIVLESLF